MLLIRGRDRSRQRAGTQHQFQLASVPQLALRIRGAERDAGITARDARLNHRSALHAAIQDDGEATLDVGARDALENVAARIREAQGDVPTAEAVGAGVRLRASITNQVTGELGSALQQIRAPADVRRLLRDRIVIVPELVTELAI